jgi:transcriptional regulator with XRE-family HTH domain
MSEPSPRTGTAPWLRRLIPWTFRKSVAAKPPDPLRATGQVLREAREAKGLGLRDLAQRTRISIAVLEALEGGWKDRLPEATYLRAMLPLLEQQLDLPAGSLEPVLPLARGSTDGGGRWAAHQVAPFSPATLQLLASWQSALLYGLLVLGLVYGVNLQQHRLASMGRLAVPPIPLGPNDTSEPDPEDPFPDLHPLKLAAKGQAMNLLTQSSKGSGPDLSLGLLNLSLSQPTQMDLRSPRSGSTQLEGLEGELSLPVLPPFELRLSPAPPPSAVRWKGQALVEHVAPGSKRTSSNTNQTGVYTVPVIPPPKSVAPPGKTP